MQLENMDTKIRDENITQKNMSNCFVFNNDHKLMITNIHVLCTRNENNKYHY